MRHRIANAALAIHEGSGQKVRDIVGGLVAEDAELKGKTEAIGSREASERWWYRACQDAHQTHGLEEDLPALSERGVSCCGCLEVEFLCSAALVREDGQEVLEPGCQFSLGGRNTGLLQPVSAEDGGGGSQGSTARFAVEELAGTDLRVNVFDRGSSQFRMGFEHQAFCGGAFVPLLALFRHNAGGVVPLGLPLGRRFEARLELALLPLALLRTKRKLEPGELSGAKQPGQHPGHICLRLLLTLASPAPCALLAGPSPPAATAPAAPVGDAKGVLSAAGATAARVGRACSADALATAWDELRGELAPATALHTWWAASVLLAPAWLWPLLLAAMLPLLSWKLSAVVERAALQRPLRLYIDEVPKPSEQIGATGQVQKAVKDAVLAQLSLMQLVEACNRLAGQLERAQFVIACGDLCQSAVFGLGALASAAAASVALWVLLLWGGGGLRSAIWLAGSCALLPQHAQSALQRALERVGLRGRGRALPCAFRRVPDSVEAGHLRLVERYALVGG